MTSTQNAVYPAEPLNRRPAFPLQLTERKALLFTIDLILVNLAVLLALMLWPIRSSENLSLAFVLVRSHWFVILTALWIIVSTIVNLYDLNLALAPLKTLYALSWSFGLTLFAYLALYFASPRNALPRLFFLYYLIFAFILLVVWRLTFHLVFQKAPFQRRTLIVGTNWGSTILEEALQNASSSGYQFVGLIDAFSQTEEPTQHGLPTLGTYENLPEIVHHHGVSDLVLATTGEMPTEMIRNLVICQEQGIRITSITHLFEELTGRLAVEHLGNQWHIVLPLDHPGTGSIYPGLKRLFDLGCATLGLLILALILPFVAIAMYLDSPGPLFYTQERIGKGGKPFRIWKLRSMVVDAEKQGAMWARKNDPRVTRVGRLLRKTSLDELPQFWNIIRGEMSIVGPRPERPVFVEELAAQIPFYRLRHAVKPGMAGWALIHYGYGSSVEDALIKLQYDLYYIKHQSIFLDIVILLRSIGHMLKFAGR